MDYTEFKDQITEDLREFFSERGSEMDVSINTVNKLNDSYEALTVKPMDGNIGVNIPISLIIKSWLTCKQIIILQQTMNHISKITL